ILKAKEKIKFDNNQIPILPFSKNRKEYFTRYYNSLKFKNVLSDAKLSLLLGVRPIKPQGYSKTYILKDLNHKSIAVFKPKIGDSLSTEAPFFLTRWQNKFLNLIGFGGSIYTFVAGNCHIAEKASYVIDQKINTNIVPPTDIVNLDPRIYKRKKANNQRGSFQLFAQNAISAKDFLGVYKNYNKVFDFINIKPRTKLYLDKLPSHLFDKLVINDVLEGNMDRHSENWLVILDDKDKKKAKDIVLIDGGMAFSPKHANTSFERSKQYFWAKESFPWANRRFSSEAKKTIKEIFSQTEKLQEELFYTYVSEGDKEKIAKKRAQAMSERIQMLHYVANIKDLPIYKLREYRTEKEINNAIKKLNDTKK
ncbi:MAG: hypothetical protein JXA94_07215, partial [Parachlamydiales bacterium]|nr:hypothetical protein [Parachlamydiales bacterium]